MFIKLSRPKISSLAGSRNISSHPFDTTPLLVPRVRIRSFASHICEIVDRWEGKL
jgi:hypothetical protein